MTEWSRRLEARCDEPFDRARRIDSDGRSPLFSFLPPPQPLAVRRVTFLTVAIVPATPPVFLDWRCCPEARCEPPEVIINAGERTDGSLPGLLGSWATLPFFPSQLFLSGWVPLLYGVANTVLQGIFCLGLIWRMNPLEMPHAFCIAQTVLTQIAWACLSGLCASVSLSTAAVALNSCPGFFRTATRLPVTVTLVVVFPAIVLVLQLALLLKLDAVQPVNGMNCDASHPTWVRVLGYAGLTLGLSVPSFVLSLMAAMRLIFKSQQYPLHKSRPSSRVINTQDALTAIPDRRQRQRDSKANSNLNVPFTALNNSSQDISPSPLLLPKAYLPDADALGRAPTVAKHSKYHLPFDVPPAPSAPHSRRSSALSHPPSQARSSPVMNGSLRSQRSNQNSPSPIMFASPSKNGSQNNTVVISVSRASDRRASAEEDKESGPIVQVQADEADDHSDEATTEVMHSMGMPDRGSIAKDQWMYENAGDENMSLYVLSPYPRIRRLASGQPPWLDEPAEPEPPLLLTVIFQLFISSTLILATISSLIDIFSQRHTPSPFGTQHVAQLLAAWAPRILPHPVSTPEDVYSQESSPSFCGSKIPPRLYTVYTPPFFLMYNTGRRWPL
ncbi:hypothetical protein NM688_g661 [Phlebia brevispora]|uniref:Uncharacterized protein n=1 Tax=Phlebia brevispora TaxID=194682 RepID=A0ACC1TDQ0_9APHY|nr:hypothetical protein NM688_g661 [Phlebia brevispora]